MLLAAISETDFLRDLAVLMVVAGLTAALFARFGWPKVIGYILGGVLMNEHTLGGGFLVDPGSVQIAGQIGVVSACLLAALPTISSPLALKATTDGVVGVPSGFGMTLTVPSACK